MNSAIVIFPKAHVSAAQLLAFCLRQMWPNAPVLQIVALDHGFYCDFAPAHAINNEHLAVIEQKMSGLIKGSVPIRVTEMLRSNAIAMFSHQKERAKAQSLKEGSSQLVELCDIDGALDISIGPQVNETREIGHVKLLSVIDAPAPFVGSVRISGIVAPDKETIKAKTKREKTSGGLNHCLLGPQLELFTLVEGREKEEQCLWYPQGVLLRERLIAWWKQVHKDQNMPQMIVPTGYFSKKLPERYSELNDVVVDYPQLSLCGLLRARHFLADRATIICRKDQLEAEVISSLKFLEGFAKMFELEVKWRLHSFRFKSAALQHVNDLAEGLFKTWDSSLEKEENSPDKSPDRNPKLEMLIADRLDCYWPCSSLAFDLTHKDSGSFVLRRSIFGSLERFIALLLENGVGIKSVSQFLERKI